MRQEARSQQPEASSEAGTARDHLQYLLEPMGMQHNGGIHVAHAEIGYPVSFRRRATGNKAMAAQPAEFAMNASALAFAHGGFLGKGDATAAGDFAGLKAMDVMFPPYNG